MKINPGLYEFVWYEPKETGAGKKKTSPSHIKRWTHTLAINESNAVENTLKMARATSIYDNMSFSYAKIAVCRSIWALCTKTSVHSLYSIYHGWSKFLRYVPAKDKYTK